jgi:hypothetical protein
VIQNRRISTTLIAERLGVGNEATRNIFERDWQKKKILSRFVPHSITSPDKNKKSEDKKIPYLAHSKHSVLRYKRFL